MKIKVIGDDIAVYMKSDFKEPFKENKSLVKQKKDTLKTYDLDDKNVKYYIDNGYPGTLNNRPSFKKLLKDMENNKVNTLIVSSLSVFDENLECFGLIKYYQENYGIRFYINNYEVKDVDLLYKETIIKYAINQEYKKMYSRRIDKALEEAKHKESKCLVEERKK